MNRCEGQDVEGFTDEVRLAVVVEDGWYIHENSIFVYAQECSEFKVRRTKNTFSYSDPSANQLKNGPSNMEASLIAYISLWDYLLRISIFSLPTNKHI